jgi:DNA-binding LacI/PurR family transcriptional regulator
VDAGNVNGVSSAARHLIKVGRRHIAAIAGPPDMAIGLDRYGGWRHGMAAGGARPEGVERADLTMEGAVSGSTVSAHSRRLVGRLRRRWSGCWPRIPTWTRCSPPPT